MTEIQSRKGRKGWDWATERAKCKVKKGEKGGIEQTITRQEMVDTLLLRPVICEMKRWY